MSTQDASQEPQEPQHPHRGATIMYRMSKLIVLVQAALSEEAGQTDRYAYFVELDESLNLALEMMHASGRMDYSVAPVEWWQGGCLVEAVQLMEAVDTIFDDAGLSHALD